MSVLMEAINEVNHLRRRLDEVKRDNGDLRKILRSLESSGHCGDGSKACPVCGYAVDFESGKHRHASDCTLKAALVEDGGDGI